MGKRIGELLPIQMARGTQMQLNKIYNENCLETMSKMQDEFVDLVVTSPPYDNLRDYKGYSFEFEKIAQELYRVVKKGGVVVWVVNDSTVNGSESTTSFKQAIYFNQLGFNLHDTMIYGKKNPLPLNHNRYEQTFEYMFIFSKGKPNNFNPIMDKTTYSGDIIKSSGRDKDGSLRKSHSYGKKINDEKIKNNIWYYDTGFNKGTTDKIAFKHPATFPDKLAYDHIVSWSNENDIVYDPFMGSGTTAKMAYYSKRKYIGSEISKEYCEIAEKRLLDTVEGLV
jgi:site-specific DNA-methyltransferase (adenine-specific)